MKMHSAVNPLMQQDYSKVKDNTKFNQLLIPYYVRSIQCQLESMADDE